MKQHYKLQQGTEVYDSTGKKAVIYEYAKYQNRNHYYWVQDIETGELKEVQYSNILRNNFLFQNKKKKDKELNKILSKKYQQIIWRIATRKSYSDTINRFKNYDDFYDEVLNQLSFDDFFVSRKHFIQKLKNKDIEIDKDLISNIFMKAGMMQQKEYSLLTILATSKNENRGKIREAINSGNVQTMLNCLKGISELKFQLVVSLLAEEFQKNKKGA